MYPVSERYVQAAMSNSVSSTWYGRIVTSKNVIYNLNARNFVSSGSEITSQICTGDSIEIGTTCASSISLDIYLDYDESTQQYFLNDRPVNRYDFYGGIIQLTYRLFFNDSEFEDVPIKTFTISDAERTADILSLTGYDNMLKFETVLGATGNGNGYTFLRTACNACEVVLGTTSDEFDTFPNGTLGLFISPQAENKIRTWRDLIGYIAEVVCGYAYIGHDDMLYVKPYKIESIREIPTTWRYSSLIADYDTLYTKLTAVYALTKETEMVKTGLDPDAGLTYDIGINPFLQFNAEDIRKASLSAILGNLYSASYTPFSAKVPLDPSFEVGDVVTLVGGQAQGVKTSIITKMTYSLSGSMSLECKGENPKLAQIETGLDKRFNSLLSDESEDPIRYYDYTNVEDIEIEDGESKCVIIFRYSAVKTSRVELSSEILLYLDTTEMIEDDSYSENSGWLKVTYYINGEKIEGYQPIEEYMDGEHILPLIYEFTTDTTTTGIFEVWITMKGASVFIGQEQVRAYISGIGLVGDSAWDGKLYISQNFLRINIANLMLKQFTDAVTMSNVEDIPDTSNENMLRINFADTILKEFVGEVQQVSRKYMFNVAYNSGDVSTSNVSYGDGVWYNTNPNIDGTVTTPNCTAYRIQKVISNEIANNGAVTYIVSFDEGGTWYSYSNGWTEYTSGYGMVSATLASITTEQWREMLDDTIMVRAQIQNDAQLIDINIYVELVNTDYFTQEYTSLASYNERYITFLRKKIELNTDYEYESEAGVIDEGYLAVVEIDTSHFSMVNSIETYGGIEVDKDLNHWAVGDENWHRSISFSNGVNTLVMTATPSVWEDFHVTVPVKKNTSYRLTFDFYTPDGFTMLSNESRRAYVWDSTWTYTSGANSLEDARLLGYSDEWDKIASVTAKTYNAYFYTGDNELVTIQLGLGSVYDGVQYTLIFADIEVNENDI